MEEKWVYLIGKRECIDVGVYPTKMSSVYDF
jgi:hypothetical protein